MPVHATITFVKPYADLSYRKLEATDIKFADFLMLFHTDTVLLSDVVGVLTAKNFNESLNITEAQFFNTSKGLADTANVSDALVHAVNYVRAFSDGFTLDDLFVGADTFQRTTNNVANLSDVIGLSAGKNLADSFSMSEALAQTFAKAIADNATLSEVLTTLNGKGLSDSISFTDTQGFAHSKSLSDGFTLDDAALVNKNYSGNKGNVFSISDQISISRTHGKALGNMALNSLTLN